MASYECPPDWLVSRTPDVPTGATWVVVAACSVLGACQPSSSAERAAASTIVQLLTHGQPVFGVFSGEKTPEQGVLMGRLREPDFVFYSLERGPFDIPQMQAYMRAMPGESGDGFAHPVALRIPPIRAGADSARARVQQGLAAGVAAIVFPHVETVEDAAIAVDAMGHELWPGNPEGTLVNMLIIEDRVGVDNARAIVGTPGVSVVFAGPGDLRRAYDGDIVAVEDAIQAVLAACREFDVPCGITAGVDDIRERLEQGFRVIIVSEREALVVGRAAAGRNVGP